MNIILLNKIVLFASRYFVQTSLEIYLWIKIRLIRGEGEGGGHPVFPRWYRFSILSPSLSVLSVFLETYPCDLTPDHPPDTKS